MVVIESCSTDDDGSCVSYLDSEKRSPLHAAAFMVLTIGGGAKADIVELLIKKVSIEKYIVKSTYNIKNIFLN